MRPLKHRAVLFHTNYSVCSRVIISFITRPREKPLIILGFCISFEERVFAKIPSKTTVANASSVDTLSMQATEVSSLAATFDTLECNLKRKMSEERAKIASRSRFHGNLPVET
jgi:hypothetical protein